MDCGLMGQCMVCVAVFLFGSILKPCIFLVFIFYFFSVCLFSISSVEESGFIILLNLGEGYQYFLPSSYCVLARNFVSYFSVKNKRWLSPHQAPRDAKESQEIEGGVWMGLERAQSSSLQIFLPAPNPDGETPNQVNNEICKSFHDVFGKRSIFQPIMLMYICI